MNYIDIFAGCGGLSVGLFNAGLCGLFAIEKNIDAFTTLKYNLIDNKKHFNWPDWLDIKEHDINTLLEEHRQDLLSLQGKVSLVAGGPPCQGFSLAGKRDNKDSRNKLVKSYIKFISLVQPEALLLENVYGFTVNFKTKQGSIKKYSSYVIDKLKDLGYKTSSKIIDVSNYGIPQKRRRFILIAMKKHNPNEVFSILENNKSTFCSKKKIQTMNTVFDAISDLEKSCGICQSPDTKSFKAGIYGKINSRYQKLMRKDVVNKFEAVDSHRFVNHSNEIIKLHQDLINLAPKGKRITPKDNVVNNLKRRGVTILNKKTQAPTLTSIPDELVHYIEPRILTVREYARIQSFPDWFKFRGKYTSGGKRRKFEVPRYTQVGNAVPPLFAEQIGLALMEVMNGKNTI